MALSYPDIYDKLLQYILTLLYISSCHISWALYIPMPYILNFVIYSHAIYPHGIYLGLAVYIFSYHISSWHISWTCCIYIPARFVCNILFYLLPLRARTHIVMGSTHLLGRSNSIFFSSFFSHYESFYAWLIFWIARCIM